MAFLPEGVLTEIVKRVGKEGFRELGPLIASGKDGKEAAYDVEVLREVDIDEFVFVPSLANEDSIYRYFFLKCFEAGNTTATYVEGLRLAVLYGPSEQGLRLLQCAEDTSVYAQFASAMFSICSGRFEEAMVTLARFYAQVNYLDEVVEIADAVMDQIKTIGPPIDGNYNWTYKYPGECVPACVTYWCNFHNVCFDCLAFWYSEHVRDFC